jgi:hypothetical protein
MSTPETTRPRRGGHAPRRLHRRKIAADERFEKIGTYEIYQVKYNLVNGLPPRYRGESE